MSRNISDWCVTQCQLLFQCQSRVTQYHKTISKGSLKQPLFHCHLQSVSIFSITSCLLLLSLVISIVFFGLYNTSDGSVISFKFVATFCVAKGDPKLHDVLITYNLGVCCSQFLVAECIWQGRHRKTLLEQLFVSPQYVVFCLLSRILQTTGSSFPTSMLLTGTCT